MCGSKSLYTLLFLCRSEVGKKKPTRYDQCQWNQASTFNLFWVDKEGHMFLIEDEQDLVIGTKEMLRTACTLYIVAEPKK